MVDGIRVLGEIEKSDESVFLKFVAKSNDLPARSVPREYAPRSLRLSSI